MGFRLDEQQDCSEGTYYNLLTGNCDILLPPPTHPTQPPIGTSDNNSNQDSEYRSEYIRKRAQQLSQLASCIGSSHQEDCPCASYQELLGESENTSLFKGSLCLDNVNAKHEIIETLKKIADLVNSDVCELNQPSPPGQYDKRVDNIPPPDNQLPFGNSQRPSPQPLLVTRKQSHSQAKSEKRQQSVAQSKSNTRRKSFSPTKSESENRQQSFSSAKYSEREDSVDQTRDADATETTEELPAESVSLHVTNHLFKKELITVKCSDTEIDDLRDKILGIISLIEGNPKSNCGCPPGESGDTYATHTDRLPIPTGADNQQRQGARRPTCFKFRIIVLILIIFNCSLIAYGCANVLTESITITAQPHLGYIGMVVNNTDTSTSTTAHQGSANESDVNSSESSGEHEGKDNTSRPESLESSKVADHNHKLDLSEDDQKALCEGNPNLSDEDYRFCRQRSCRIVKRVPKCSSAPGPPPVKLPSTLIDIQIEPEKEEETIYENPPEIVQEDVELMNEKQSEILEESLFTQVEPEPEQVVYELPNAILNENPPATTWQNELVDHDDVVIKDDKYLYPPLPHKCGVGRPSDADPHFVRKCQERLEEQLANAEKAKPFNWCDYNLRWMAYIIKNQKCS